MPPKRKGRGRPPTRGRGKTTKRKSSTSEEEHSVSDTEFGDGFDKNLLQKVKYNFQELMADETFNHPEFIHTIDPSELTMEYFEKTGLEHPIHFRCDPKLIGMTVPDSSFSVENVLELVGGNRIIEVVQVKDQGSVKMTLQEFIDFYKTPADQRTTLYNVLSLEFSLTPLEDLVKSPSIVREVDWVGTKWPDALRQRWIGFNGKDKNLYTPHHTFPKVQNYCLMSVADCYTDFHIDFSGTSVWYHVLKGKKVFWLIPPTETNFILYQEFIQTAGDVSFFGKSVEKCHMAVLEPGDTMLIPSGWIHAVYTPSDSLVFGGNFLHSLSCKMQIRVYQCENRLNITRKFRLPYNEELIFYVIADYVKKWTGREYARPLRIEDARLDYVGEKWIQAGGHLKKIEYSDFEHGVELTNDMIHENEHNESTEKQAELKVIAMHAENTLYSRPMTLKPAAADSLLDAEEDETEEESKTINVTKQWDDEIDERSINNPLIFYKNAKHDFVRNKCVPDHKLPVGHEPPLEFNQEELDKISERLLVELEALAMYLKRKTKVEVAEGICQPASLLNAFLTVLKKRKIQLGKEEENEKEPKNVKRKYTRASLESGEYEASINQAEESAKSNSVKNDANLTAEKVEDFPENLVENEKEEEKIDDSKINTKLESEQITNDKEDENSEEPNEVVKKEENTPSKENSPTEPRRSSRRKASKAANESIKEELKEVEEELKSESNGQTKTEVVEEKEREKMENDEKKEEKSKKVKLTKEERKEKKKKEEEKKRKSLSLDAALNAAHGNSKSKKKKPEKPQFVGGLPVAPIQNEPVVANPYNYDPKMEMIKLGTGQLKSAYRKSKNNIELRFEKKMYKLDPKRKSGEEEDDDDNNDEEGKAENKKEKIKKEILTPSTAPISIDIFDMPSSSKKRKESLVKPGGDLKRKNASPIEASPSPKISSPASVFSPGSSSFPGRRKSDTTSSTTRKSIFTSYVSRQDRMIAESSSPVQTSRHSSFSEKRSLNLPVTPVSTPKTSSSSENPYTPSAPPVQKSSWMSTGSIDHKESIDESPIDVVADSVPSPHTPINVTASPSLLHEITSPPGLVQRNSRSSISSTNGRNSDSPVTPIPAKRTNRIPAEVALKNIKTLIGQLNQLNETD